jgi:hypothetical protein
MNLLINKTMHSHTTFDITLSDEDIEECQGYLDKASKTLYDYAVSHQLTIKESYYSFTLDQQKVNLDAISANIVLSIISDFIDFESKYIPRGSGCEVCFELFEKRKD